MHARTPTPNTAVTVALCVAAAVVIAPLWTPLILAAWFADLLRPAVRRLEHVLGGRRRAAGAVVVLLALGVLLPVVGTVLALISGTQDLLHQLRAVLEGHGSLAGALLGGTTHAPPQVRDWADLVSRYGANAWRAVSIIAHASATAAIGLLVFIAALYAFAVEGERAYAWLETNAPMPRASFARLAGAFRETGRGLFVAGGGTALVQGVAATVGYVAIGLPRGLLLGALTAVCAIVPLVGTGLVWIPLAIELAATGQYWRAGVVVLMGAGVHSLIDNFVRPMLARYGRLTLPASVVLVSMIGGAAVFGAAGALLGPLLVRLCVESLAIASEQRADAAGLENAASTSRERRNRGLRPPTSGRRASESAGPP
jgi:predicted PurR-regulated permease PerM